jgi:hypothetical protein
MTLAATWLALWDETRDVFRQRRVWERARRLAFSQLACLERHTVTGLLCCCGRQFVDWSADYRLFSKHKWELNGLFRPVIRGGLSLQPDPNRLAVAIDDTLLHKSSRKTPGVSYRRDPMGPPFQTNLILAQRFLQFSLLVPDSTTAQDAARALPCRFEHVPSVKKPKKKAPKDEWKAYREMAKQKNLNTAAHRMIGELRQELDTVHGVPDCHLVLLVDGSYTNKTILRGLPPNTTLIGRIRKDAALHFPHERLARRYGPVAPTPEALHQDDAYPWHEVQAYAAGKTHTFRVKTLAPVRWRKAGPTLPLRVVAIAPVGYRLTQHGRILYRQPAYLVCTDPDLPLRQLVQEYLWRWDIEVNHRDEKQVIGVGQAQVWSPHSVDRHSGFAVASYSMLLLAAMIASDADALHALLPLPKWYKEGAYCRLSTQRLVQMLRCEIWARALEEIAADAPATDFVTDPMPNTKSPETILAPVPPIAYARTG